MKFIYFLLLLIVSIQNPTNANNIWESNINTIFSLNEFIYLENPFDHKLCNESEIKGSVILSWKSKWSEPDNAFGHILIYIPGTEGGRLEIKLIQPTFSDSEKIEGIWMITRNRNKNVLYGSGVISGLNQTFGQSITFSFAEKTLIKARISFCCAYHTIQPEIAGQIKQKGEGINNAMVTLTQKNKYEETLPTFGNGDYNFFLTNKDNLESMRIRFSNPKEPYDFTGNIYIHGTPWQNAQVELRINTILIDTINTDHDGFFHFSNIKPEPTNVDKKNQEIDILLKTN